MVHVDLQVIFLWNKTAQSLPAGILAGYRFTGNGGAWL